MPRIERIERVPIDDLDPVFRIGRGVELFEHAVRLEPVYYAPPEPIRNPLIDDGRIENRISGLFRRRIGTEKIAVPDRIGRPTDHGLLADTQPTVFRSIRIYLPVAAGVDGERVAQLLTTLAHSAPRISFEIVATASSIVIQIACPESHTGPVRSQLATHFPEIESRVAPDELERILLDMQDPITVDLGLKNHWFLPLASGDHRRTDPLTPLFAVLERLRGKEAFVFQVMFEMTRRPWRSFGTKTLFDRSGKLLFPALTDQSKAIREKLDRPLFAVAVRMLASGETGIRSTAIAREAAAYVKQFGHASRNELIPLRHDLHSPEIQKNGFLERVSYREGVLLSIDELTSIVRFPGDALRTRKLERLTNRTRPAPAPRRDAFVRLGTNDHAGDTREVRISPAHHSLIIGGTGAGKTTLLQNIMVQNAEHGLGFALIDPHGDLVDDLIARLPEKRLKDVIIFDPSDTEFPIGFNILQANSDLEKNFLASDLVETFRQHSTSWGDVMDAVISNACLAFVDSHRGGTLFDLKRFLVEKSFRDEYLASVSDDTVRYFWENEFPQVRGRPQSSVLVRLDAFLRHRMIRNIVCQTGTGLNMRRVLDEQKILLVKLSQGLVGEANASLLGLLLISKLYQTALTRQDTAIGARTVFPVYIDEAAHFVGSPSMTLILANLRKYGVALNLSIQNFRQLQNKNKDVADSVLANCQVRICFRLGDMDAEKLQAGFEFFDSSALQNLGVGEAIMRIERSDNDFNLRTLPSEPVAPGIADRRKAAVIGQSRKNYATPVKEVETQFRFGLPQERKATSRARSYPSEVEHTGGTPHVAPEPPQPGTELLPVLAPTVAAEPSQGRGSPHHKELQGVIRRMGETYGFQCEIEKGLADGGWVDVSLENDSIRIACEVSVTTTGYEVTNVAKCLAANYDHTIVVVSNPKKVQLIDAKVKASLPLGYHDRVKVLGLVDLLAFLRSMSTTNEREITRTEKRSGHRLDFAGACELLGKSSSTLYRWVREGRVPFYRVGREYEFDRSELLLVGKHDLSGKRKATVRLEPLSVEKTSPKIKKEQDAKYRKLLHLDKIDVPLRTRREKEAHDKEEKGHGPVGL